MTHATTATNNPAQCHMLEQRQPFSHSLLWELQRNYFNERGADAWRAGEVPHYITSNPTMAATQAELVFAFYQDRQRLLPSDEVLTICELGAGSGRFAFHFLRHLLALCKQHQLSAGAFRYVLSDFTQSNLDAWRKHPRLQAWFDSGLLDMALFDVNHSAQLSLQLCGQVIGTASLRHPLVVLANYVFDGVPQDLFYFKDGKMYDVLVSLACPTDPATLDAAQLLAQVQPRYDYQPSVDTPYPEPALQALLALYCAKVQDAHVLFPMTGLRCLARLRTLSQAGMLLLSSDKGNEQLAGVARQETPTLARHGSFSLSVNYHAFLAWGEACGALALRPPNPHRSVALIGLLLLEQAAAHGATSRTYHERMNNASPDDFYTLAKALYRQIADMTFAEIMAYMRFNRADAHQLGRLMPRLTALAGELKADEVLQLKQMFDTTWEGYFPLGEKRDLAFEIACLLYNLNEFASALRYFERSCDIYGRSTGKLFNMAACHEQMGQYEKARPLLETVLKTTPENAGARQLLAQLPAFARAPSPPATQA